MSKVHEILIRTLVLWHFSLALAALLCSSLPTTTTASLTTTSSELGATGDDGEAKNDEDDDEARLSQLWLDDFDVELRQVDDDDVMLSDYPQMLGDETGDVDAREADDNAPTCPPPPNSLPSFACSVEECESDKTCPAGTLCCFNGCRYTCMTPVQPAPYVDWKRQPQSRLIAGSSWLVPGPEEEEEAEWCSTSTEMFGEDEDPLLCPHGYVCHVEESRDPDSATPNIGRCVQQFTVDKQKAATEEDAVDCQVGLTHYANGSSFKYNQHNCVCENGSVLCRVGKVEAKSTTNSRTRTRN